MLPIQTKQLKSLVSFAVKKYIPNKKWFPNVYFEYPKLSLHGDISTNVAMQLARYVKEDSYKIAKDIVNLLRSDYKINELVEEIKIAKPGFINFYIKANSRLEVISVIEDQGNFYGYYPRMQKKILIEFVSANPTGPLHIGHARQAVLGDVICRLYDACGWDVTREFYYNDSGNQIKNLVISVQARALGLSIDSPMYPIDGYKGDYISEIANDFLQKKSIQIHNDRYITASGNVHNLDDIREFSVAYLRCEQDLDLKYFGITFDNYYLESSLYTDGLVNSTIQTFIDNGYTYKFDNALWLRTTILGTGDDKDRVIKKSDGTHTYFVPDVAYHKTKWERGFQSAINIQGSDHHGTIARVRAGLQALNENIPKNYPTYVLHRMVKIIQNGKEIKISKRSGGYITMRELIDLVGLDAARYFLIQRRSDTEFVFDIDLALSKHEENPVYYIQYAHARICSMIKKSGISDEQIFKADIHFLSSSLELKILRNLSEFPYVVKQSAYNLSPNNIAIWLRNFASNFHTWYTTEHILVNDMNLKLARLRLAKAIRQVLFNGLTLIGISAPEQM